MSTTQTEPTAIDVEIIRARCPTFGVHVRGAESVRTILARLHRFGASGRGLTEDALIEHCRSSAFFRVVAGTTESGAPRYTIHLSDLGHTWTRRTEDEERERWQREARAEDDEIRRLKDGWRPR